MGAGSLLATPAIVRAQGQNGVALVIGNSKYAWEAQLPNVRRDAPDVAKHFQALGLKTELVVDAGRDAMNRAIANFGAAANGSNFAAFYYAGHGAQWGKDMFLVPIDADLSTPSTVQTLVNSLDVGKANKGAANRLTVFDNCRNNPADGWRQVDAEQRSLAVYGSDGQLRGGAWAPNPNTLVLFSTAPGHIALDGPAGQNSPFAAAFLRQFNDASVDLQSLSSRLRRDLLITTRGRQVLFDRNSFTAPFSISGSPRPGSAAVGGDGWGADPSRIIELTKAYAYARENGLPLPSGLIAHRLPGGGRDGQKVGSFQFVRHTPIGGEPALLVVISAEEQQTAEVVMTARGVFNEKTQKMEGGSIWRYITARIAGDRLEFTPRGNSERYMFDWRDANSGSFSVLSDQARTAGPSIRFVRLDG